MKKHYLKLLVLLLVSMSTYGQNIKFIDANFKEALLGHKNPVVDTNKDGEISISEAKKVTRLNLSSKRIINLKEISYFINLTSFYCYRNDLSSLDISKNTRLTMLDCSENRLTTLDISKNLKLWGLKCNSNSLKALYITSSNLELRRLYCNNNQLTNLDFLKNLKLYSLNCSDNQLTSLDVRNNKLRRIYFENNAGLTEVYLTNQSFDKGEVKFEGCPKLNFICVDKSQVDNFEKLCEKYNYISCNIGINCKEKIKFTDYFKLYPNPTTHILNIEPIRNDIKVEFIYIYNNYGNLVTFFYGTVKQLNLDFLDPEYYHVRLETNKGMLSAPFLIKR